MIVMLSILSTVLNFRVMGPVSSEGPEKKKSKAQKAKS